MSIDDLAILADALTFALFVTVGGLAAWAVYKASSSRPGLRRSMKVGMSVLAILAVAFAGVAGWPAGDGAEVVAGGVDDRVGRSGTVPMSGPVLARETGPSSPSQSVSGTGVQAPTRAGEADVANSGGDPAGDPTGGATNDHGAQPGAGAQAVSPSSAAPSAPSDGPDGPATDPPGQGGGPEEDGEEPSGHDEDPPPGH